MARSIEQILISLSCTQLIISRQLCSMIINIWLLFCFTDCWVKSGDGLYTWEKTKEMPLKIKRFDSYKYF
jgi:hypothetical protein